MIHFFLIKMPTILKHEIEKFETKKDSFIPNNTKDKFNYYKSPYIKQTETEEGGSLFSGLVSGIKSGVNLLRNNSGLISNVAKGATAIGSTAASIAQAVKSSKDLEQIKRVQEMRNNALEREKRRQLSEKTKQRLKEKLASGNGLSENGLVSKNGFVLVEE